MTVYTFTLGCFYFVIKILTNACLFCFILPKLLYILLFIILDFIKITNVSLFYSSKGKMPLFGKSHKSPGEIVRNLSEALLLIEKGQERKSEKAVEEVTANNLVFLNSQRWNFAGTKAIYFPSRPY